jgi:hypothetical protein
MPAPLHFSEEKDLLLALHWPSRLIQRLPPDFLAAVAQELEAMRTSAGPRRHAWGHASIQKKYSTPPELPNASRRFRSA